MAWLGRAAAGADTLGGKAASLDRLGRMGFNVPPGFCLTTEAFQMQLAALPDAVEAVGRLVATRDAAHGAQIAGRLVAAPLVPEVGTELANALATLDQLARERSGGQPPRLAVRSSAIGEDGSAASYAGLHETELDRSIDEVPGAVARCWASLWSAPALAYRLRRSLPLDGAAMAVVVQELVPADASAVAFTRHPVTGRDDQVVITTARGLGEAMVSGDVTPDTFVIDKATRSVIDLEPGDEPVRPVSSEQLASLIDLVLDVEAKFGAAVDVEAAISAGTWYLLQARPITTGVSAAGAAR
ncbi:MAG TPA: PEP/pyruvate-binding domain-containing protein [Candidatus Limnocylindrales bacterium]